MKMRAGRATAVMAGIVPAIHVLLALRKAKIATRPGTKFTYGRIPLS